jgi:hypothetical protein
MNPQFDQPVSLAEYERNAVRKRLAQIAVALGHPRLPAEQFAALIRERKRLERVFSRTIRQDREN